MKYVAPIAERVSLETVSVILASGGCNPDCPTELPED